MAVIEMTNIIEGALGIRTSAGAPGAGTDEVQTLTIDATGGTFKLAYDSQITASIAWSATNNTLRDNVDAALEALSNVGAGNVTTAVGTMTAGVGTLTITFTGALAKKAVNTITVNTNALTGTKTLTIAETTPGVDAANRGAPLGALTVDTTNGILYQASTANPTTWAKVGTQS
jgi:hypothetical protein